MSDRPPPRRCGQAVALKEGHEALVIERERLSAPGSATVSETLDVVDLLLQVPSTDEDGAVTLPYGLRRLVLVENGVLGGRRVGERARGQWRGFR
jgi:hypothetical protein